MKRRRFLQSIPAFTILPLFFRQECNSRSVLSSDPHEAICLQKFEHARSLKLGKQPINSVVAALAQSFLDAGYSAHTLESTGPEQLVVNLQTFDCVTFYENTLALARCVKKKRETYEAFKRELQFIRYRNGLIDGYPSRLHYTTDYFYNNEKKGVLRNITKQLGGVPLKKTINFMSTHSDSYAPLKANPNFLPAIELVEKEINSRPMYSLPKRTLQNTEKQIQDGDILGITTSIPGLDCSHTGIALWQNKRLHMIHAPSPGLKVQTTPMPLQKYLLPIKAHTGIIVARVVEP